MSVHKIRLPSPPPDFQPRRSMTGLFNRHIQQKGQADPPIDPTLSDVEGSIKKRVGFHPWTTNILEPQLSTPDSEIAPSLKSLPPSRDCQISNRPILKAFLSTESVSGFDGIQERKSHLDVMESLLGNLEVNDRAASLDAYQTMVGLIKNYDEPPESEVLQAKMPKLQSFMKRDLIILDTAPESLTSEERLSLGNLVHSALKLLVTMVWSPIYSPCLTDEFCIWAVDRAILILKEHNAAKAVLLHYMHLIATQNFRTSIFTNNQGYRAIRILEALQNLTDHVSGKAVIAERLLVYEKLMMQAKQIMERKVALWMKNLLSAIGHGFKEVRKNALSAGAKACSIFFDSSAIAVATREALAEVSGERSLSASLTNRLERILAAKDDANQIPQLWTVVLTLCNIGKSNNLDTWSQEQLYEWLKLIQRCFNSSDTAIVIQATIAWNRLYYIARPHEASDKILSLLAKPTLKNLEVIAAGHSSKGMRQAAMSSYCMLLYYAFRPSLNHAQTTRMWNEFIVKIMTRNFLSRSSANCDLCCRALSALFYATPSASRIWNEKRVQDNALLDPSELSVIDAKWVRAHTSNILIIIRLLVTYSSFGPDGTVSEQSYIARCWQSFVKAIRQSSSKEVVPPPEMRAAMQGIVDFLAHDTADIGEQSGMDPKWDVLARIAVAEINVHPLLAAMESSSAQPITPLLREVICKISESIDCKENTELNQKALVRSMKLLQKGMEGIIRNGLETDGLSFGLVHQIFKICPPSEVLETLMGLELTLVNYAQSLDKMVGLDEPNPLAVQEFASVLLKVLDLFVSIRVEDYLHLDDLLSVLLSSQHELVAEQAANLQTPRVWHDIKARLGHKVRYIASKMTLSSPEETIMETWNGKSTKENRFLAKLTKNASSKKPRHDDSQVEFVSIQSSPPESVTFESQLLTARQNEVRSRQLNATVLTFADVRSSPSNTHSRKAMRGEVAREQSPQLPTTPPLPPQREQEEEDQPTPTPKVRKILQNYLQPDITSSPPSVIGAETRGPVAAPITSSPMKGLIEANDAIQLSIEDGKIALTVQKEALLAHADMTDDMEAHGYPSDYLGHLERLPSDEIPIADPPQRKAQSVEESPNIVLQSSSSSPSYSDEDDALAASQLSQSLVQRSRSESEASYPQNDLPENSKKRKRKPQVVDVAGNKKTRAETEAQKKLSLDQDEEMEDCIVVDMSACPPMTALRPSTATRRTHSKSKTSSPVSNKSSQTSSASTPASPKLSSGRRRRGRGGSRGASKQTSSQAKTAIIQIIVPSKEYKALQDSAHNEIEDVPLPNESSYLASESEETRTKSLEIEETPHSTSRFASPGPQLPVTYGETDVSDADANMNDAMDESMNDSANMPVMLVSKTVPETITDLQSILTTLNTTMNCDNREITAIQNLCWQIGLRAQQLKG